ncbi:uncharacterized protein METZ01_LOCUS351879 [marine metagenome]|uniref:Uncharacterized protein n=1 Tax=marine metagenome TaxID=408172 RepID=A0A382RPE2_9ZZZZ
MMGYDVPVKARSKDIFKPQADWIHIYETVPSLWWSIRSR